jgi:MFS family permease
MALIGAAFGLGFTLGPLIGAAALWMDWSGDSGGLSPMPGYVAAMLSATALSVAIFKLPESYDSSAVPEQRKHVDWASLKESLATPSIGLLLATSFLAIFALAGFEGTISLNMKDKFGRDGLLSDREILARVLLMFAYIGLLLCVIQGVLVRRLAGRISDGWLAMLGMGMAIAGFMLLALAVSVAGGSMLPLMLATAVEITGLAFATPAIQSLISRRSDPTKQGVILGAGESISSVARMTGMAFGVTLYTLAQSLPYWSSAAVMALALLFVLAALPRGGDWMERVPS